MPRYFFNVINGTGHQDRDGIELPDLASARIEALKDIEDISRQNFMLIDLETRATWYIEICDEAGTVLATVPFSSN